jgi:hypothetical protein
VGLAYSWPNTQFALGVGISLSLSESFLNLWQR